MISYLRKSEGVTKDFSSPRDPRNYDPDVIIREVAKAYDISPKMIGAPRGRKLEYAATQVAAYLMRMMTWMSYPQIAQKIDRKDHTTVIYIVSRVEYKIAVDKKYAKAVDELIARIKRVPVKL